MTEVQLKKYPGIKSRIMRYKRKIEDVLSQELEGVAGKVKGSSDEFPYCERRFSVQLQEPWSTEKRNRCIEKWKRKIISLEKEAEEIEEFIDDIEDEDLEEIFKIHFIEGKKQQIVAEQLGIAQSGVSRRIKQYLLHKNA